MNSLRKLVAGPKVRTIENGFDLDLTYVTNRVIAMAFPGSGLEALYRNSINDVVNYLMQVQQFLRQKHGDNYMIFNLSGRKYDYTKFNGKVKEWDWEDHQAPALYTIFQICQQATAYLQQNNSNVVIMHCNHGKGRTGTIIVSLLIFLNFFDDVGQALQFYAKRRFQAQGYGVTQPCQIRYIQYFHALLKEKKITLIPYCLKEIWFRGKYHLDDCYILTKSVRSKEQIFKSKILEQGIITVKNNYLMLGDIFMELMLGNLFGDKQLARINFNTIFIPPNNRMVITAQEMSPDKLLRKHKDKVGEDFQIQMVFQRYCECDLTQQSKDKKCKCQQVMAEQRMYWEKIYLILNSYKAPSKQKSIQLLFGEDIHHIKEALKQP